MMLRAWTDEQFVTAGFVRVRALAVPERYGFPTYASTKSNSSTIWAPGWTKRLFDIVAQHEKSPVMACDRAFRDQIARVSAAAIRSDDPDAFVAAAIAAYALGGWEAVLQLADAAQDDAHDEALPAG